MKPIHFRSVQSCEDNPFSDKFAASSGHKHSDCKVTTHLVRYHSNNQDTLLLQGQDDMEILMCEYFPREMTPPPPTMMLQNVLKLLQQKKEQSKLI